MTSPRRSRPSARLLVLDPEDGVLLFRFVFEDGALAGRDYWATPGGGVERGESFESAAARELREETGIVTPLSGEFARKLAQFKTPTGETVEADERYFVVRVADQTIRRDGQNASEARYMTEHRWWSLAELLSTSQTVFPEELPVWLQAAANTDGPTRLP